MHPIFQTLAALGVAAYAWEMTSSIRTALWKHRKNQDPKPK